jgi:hypothetical protein
MMQAYFNVTPVADAFGVTPAPGPFNFFQFYADDILYAQGMGACHAPNFIAQQNDAGTDAGLAACTVPDPGSTIFVADGSSTFVTDQQLLEQAAALIPQIAQTPTQASVSPGDE